MSWFRGGGDDSSSRSAAGVPGSGAFGGGGGPGLPPRRNPVQQQQPAAPQQGGGGGYSQYSSQPTQSYVAGGYEKQQAGGGGGGGGVPGQMPHQAARHGSKFEVVGTPVDSYVLYNVSNLDNPAGCHPSPAPADPSCDFRDVSGCPRLPPSSPPGLPMLSNKRRPHTPPTLSRTISSA